MTDKIQLLTEDSIGQVFDAMSGSSGAGKKPFQEIKIIQKINIEGKDHFVGKFTDACEYNKTFYLFNNIGLEVASDSPIYLLEKPQQEKIDYNDYHNYCIGHGYSKTKGIYDIFVRIQNVNTVNCLVKCLAVVELNEFNKRHEETNGKPYFYKGEGL